MLEERLGQRAGASAWQRLAARLAALPLVLTGCFALAYASGRLGWW